MSHLSVGRHILLSPGPECMLRSEISETAYYLLRPDTGAAASKAQALVQDAGTSATEHGFGPLLTQHAPIVCLLSPRRLDEPLHSWALTRLPGTVFTDYTAHPEILARDLIHEAAHNWLNDALTAHDVKLPGDVTFFSPWRDSPRPVFGFLHACWAFSLTVLYARQVRSDATDAAATFLDAYLRQQQRQFGAAVSSLAKALSYVSSSAIRERIDGAVREVVGA